MGEGPDARLYTELVGAGAGVAPGQAAGYELSAVAAAIVAVAVLEFGTCCRGSAGGEAVFGVTPEGFVSAVMGLWVCMGIPSIAGDRGCLEAKY